MEGEKDIGEKKKNQKMTGEKRLKLICNSVAKLTKSSERNM